VSATKLNKTFIFWAFICYIGLPILISAQSPTLGQTVPPAVKQGQTFIFTCTANCSGVVWSCTTVGGCKGSINSFTGVYTAPASIHTQNPDGGCQLLPNDHIYNIRADSMNVNANSSTWIAQDAFGHLIVSNAIPVNFADVSTPTTSMKFINNQLSNGNFQFPLTPKGQMEQGWDPNALGDHHMVTINPTTCHFNSIYYYNPSGDTCSSGTCNSHAGEQYDAASYALSSPVTTNGTTNAAGMWLEALMTHFQEWQNAVNGGGEITHAGQITMRGAALGNNTFLWPATDANFSGSGSIPFGARVRLKSTFNISGFSVPAQKLLLQLQHYGAFVDDTGSDWNIRIDGGKLPYAYQSALSEISAANIVNSNFEFVDEAGLEVSATSGATTNSETVCATNGSGSSCINVIPTGVTVGVPQNELDIQAGMGAQQLAAFVNGASNASLTWTMSPTIGTLTSGGLYTPPATVSINTATQVTATSVADNTVSATFSLVVIQQGAIRLQMGGPCGSGLTITYPVTPFNCVTTGFTDSHGNIWQAKTADNGSGELDCGAGIPPWPNTTDIGLYEIPSSADTGDLIFTFLVPNGIYSVTAKMAFHCSYDDVVGQNNFSLETQGTIPFDRFDPVSDAGGALLPVDYVFSAVVLDNHLYVAVRYHKGSVGSILSALQIVQTSSIVPSSGLYSGVTFSPGVTIQ